jgi:hypothetical protein
VFVHTPLQSAKPDGHVQRLPVHDVPPAQVTPHAPQFDGSDERLTQPPAQFVEPAAHIATHDPLLHV